MADATALKLKLMDKYKVFFNCGLNASIHLDYQKIRVHLVYDAKNDGRHHARLVANEHLTKLPIKRVHSNVVSLKRLHMSFSLLGTMVGRHGLQMFLVLP